MEELIEKLEKLKKELDKNKDIIRIKELNTKLRKDSNLTSLIDAYKINRDEKIKNKVFENSLFRDYKHCENEINFLILKIKQELKKINNEESCGR